MFSLDKKTLMKRDIVEVLDAQMQPITSKMIQKKLGNAGLTTILAVCRELQEEFSTIYPDGRAKILISSNGIALDRHGSSLQYFFDFLFSSDLSYAIIKELIRHRSVATFDFCLENGISESTLKRKVKAINNKLSAYKVRIGVSSRLSIIGEEVDIRVISYQFLLGIHRQFSRIPWLVNEKTILILSRRILEYLGIAVTDVQVEMFAIWVYVNSISASFVKKYAFTQQQTEIFASLKIPKQPDFLKLWTLNDWMLTVVLLYGTEFFDFILAHEPLRNEDLHKLFESLNSSWLALFEANFTSLTTEQKRLVSEKIYQQFVHGSFISTVDELVTEETQFFSFQQFKQCYPLYFTHFERFWQGFRQALDGLEMNFLYGKICSLLLCIYLCPIKKILPAVRIYLYTDLTVMHENFLKERIELMLEDNFEVHFEEDCKAAEIILTTVPYPISDKIKSGNQRILLVRPFFQEHDLQELFNVIEELKGFSKPMSKNSGGRREI